MWKSIVVDRYQWGRGLIIFAAAVVVIGFFSLSYNPKKGLLENVFGREIHVIAPTCYDKNGAVVTTKTTGKIASGESEFSGFVDIADTLHQDCRFGLSIPYKVVLIVSSALFFIGLYLFTAKNNVVP
jgi:hypothetical protein